MESNRSLRGPMGECKLQLEMKVEGDVKSL